MNYSESAREVTILERFKGPPNSANGGYVCGLVAQALQGACTVTLRSPPPLDAPLSLKPGEVVRLSRGGTLLAEGVAEHFELEVPAPPSLAQARASAEQYVGLSEHAYPGCFVCGPQRATGDGLRVFPGPCAWERAGAVASPLSFSEDLAKAGAVGAEFVWAALDCPGYFAVAKKGELAVLGRMSARIDLSIESGQSCVVVGWPLGRRGRKLEAATAIFLPDGRCAARAKQVWIQIEQILNPVC